MPISSGHTLATQEGGGGKAKRLKHKKIAKVAPFMKPVTGKMPPKPDKKHPMNAVAQAKFDKAKKALKK